VDVSGTQLTLDGIISGSFGLTNSGTGSSVLTAANTYTGTTTISGGTLAITNAAGLGTTGGGTTIANGASLDIRGVAVGNEAITLNGGTIKSTTGTASLSGNVAMGGNSTVDVSGTQLTLSGVISGAFDLIASGTGVSIVSGNN
ncbi:MAG: autotransporter-associated beta strand repeat-containing protein, partial [Planctomycetia bacterium]